ncbi:MAG: OmpH family outer membrane protein, partial [Myxococcota bacterium]|nr:OmpH family outer membrane protein [Myxococcota bacterium]
FVGTLVTLFLLGIGSHAIAAELKVGIVDFKRAIADTESDGALKRLKEDKDKRQKKLDELEKAIVGLEAELEEQGSLLSKEKLKEKLVDYQQKTYEYRTTLVQFEQEFAQKSAEVLGEVQRKMQEISVSIAQDNGLQLLIERNEGAVLYFDAQFDFTDELIKRYKAAKK